MATASFTTDPQGIAYRDLNRNGVMDPYENPHLPIAERVEDLLGRLSLPEKIGLMFHTVIEAGPDGSVVEGPGAISKTATSTVVRDKFINHFNVHLLRDAAAAARWQNAVQALAEQTPHRHPGDHLQRPPPFLRRERGSEFLRRVFLPMAGDARARGIEGA